jgi:hypothetical protein
MSALKCWQGNAIPLEARPTCVKVVALNKMDLANGQAIAGVEACWLIVLESIQ